LDKPLSKSTISWGSIVLLLLSLGVAFAIAEVLVRLFVPVRDVGPLFTVNDPVMGKRIKKSFHTVRVTPEFTMTFTSNSLGYRGVEPESPPTNSVLFVGDSFTMGFGVSDGQEYPALIKDMFDRMSGKDAVSVVNAGMGNNGNGRWIKLLRAEADRFKPRLVVLQLMANDYEDNVREAYFRISDGGELIELPIRNSWVRDLEPFLDAIPGLSRSHVYGLIRQVIAGQGSRTAAAPGLEQKAEAQGGLDYTDRLTERLIAQAVAICRSKQYPVFAILVGLKGERLSRVQGIFGENRIATFVVPDKTERPDLYFKIDGHWNPSGHAFVARAVFEQLQSLQPTNIQ